MKRIICTPFLLVALFSIPTYQVTAQSASLELVRISAGSFQMGDRSSRNTSWLHKVVISEDFLLGKYCITNKLFCNVMNYLIDAGELLADSKGIRARTGRLLVLSLINDDPYYHQFGIRFVDNHVAPMAGREDHPVVGVKWFGALVFCNGLSKMEGLAQTYQITGEKAKPGLDKHANGYRLPTEAEWEYAARGGNRRNIFAWGDTVDSSVANYNGSINPFTGTSSMPWENGGPTTPVGYFNGEAHGTFTTRSNECPFGLYDMGGNVAQWCWDTYLESYYSTSPEVDPQGPPKEAILHSVPWVVTRGGGWQSYPGQLRVYFRQKASPFANDFTIGFRVAKSLAP